MHVLLSVHSIVTILVMYDHLYTVLVLSCACVRFRGWLKVAK
jgi:hypothetical protein